MNSIDVENELSNNVSMENKQREFLQTGIGKAVNTGLNIGLRYLLPDVIEDQIIEIKDSFIQNGFKEGIKTAIDTIINALTIPTSFVSPSLVLGCVTNCVFLNAFTSGL